MIRVLRGSLMLRGHTSAYMSARAHCRTRQRYEPTPFLRHFSASPPPTPSDPLPTPNPLTPPTEQIHRISATDRAVYLAIAGNAFVTVIKLGGHLATGSSTMLSEAVHSAVDTLNQTLLAIGISRARRPPSEQYPYGREREQYVWALVSAVGVFFLGAGVTMREGFERLFEEDHSFANMKWAVGALAVSICVEGASFMAAFAAIRAGAARHGMSLLRYIRRGPDPLAVAVLLEDGAAVVGVVLAGGSIALCKYTDSFIWDAVGSLLIGCLLGVVAVFLIRKNMHLLIGQGIDRKESKRFVEFMHKDPSVKRVNLLKSEIMGIGAMRFTAEIDFDGKIVTQRLLEQRDVGQLWREHAQTPEEFDRFLVDFGDDVIHKLGEEIDRIEVDILKEFPEAKQVDIEAD